MFLALHTCINIYRGILDIGFLLRLLNDRMLSALAKYATSVIRHRSRVVHSLMTRDAVMTV